MALLQLAVILPLSLILAAANVVVREVEYLVRIVLQMVFFLTPIVYPTKIIPAEYKPYFNLNPFAPLIAGWREVLLGGRLDPTTGLQCLMFAALAGVAAVVVHRRVEPRMGELL
jgi:ABC-type polysaccharide/polyol phosphate export permease